MGEMGLGLTILMKLLEGFRHNTEGLTLNFQQCWYVRGQML